MVPSGSGATKTGVIDADHRHLLDIINRFENFAADGLTLDEGLEILFALKFYAATHFKREEGLQLRVNYPHYEAHKKQHAELLDQLTAIIEALRGGAGAPLDQVARETSALLQHWLMDHVLKSDLKMKAFVKAMHGDGPPLDELSAIDMPG